MRDAPPDYVPSFNLYGDLRQSGLPDLIHVEELVDRSQHHDWRIKPHRHLDLYQFMSFKTSVVGIDLDGQALQTDRPTILFVPPRVVHGFRLSPEIEGTVTTLPVELVGGDAGPLSQAVLIPEGGAAYLRIADALCEIKREYRTRRPERHRALRALVELCIAWIARAKTESAPIPAGVELRTGSDKRVGGFLALVEETYTNGWSTTEYARHIGTSKSQLTRDCRTITGRSPLQIVHDRLIKEANRKLAYTLWPISQISEELGFSDLGYFSRFYRERTGETPSAYRKRIRLRAPVS